MQKAVVMKQPAWAIILMTPIHLLEASGAPAFTLQQGGRIAVHKRRFFLKEQLGAVYGVILACVHWNWTWVCFATSWGSGHDRNRTFFVRYALKSQALYAAIPWKRREARVSVCLTMKSVMLLNSFRNNSSVDDAPSYSIRKFYQQIGLNLAAPLFSLWTR